MNKKRYISIKTKKGFTLIELMIVVAIIGILLTISVPKISTFLLKSRSDEAKAVFQAIVFKQERYRQEIGSFYPSNTSEVLNENKISKELKVDLSKSNNFNYSIQKSSDGNFTIKAMLRRDDWDSCGTTTTTSTICKQNGSSDEDSWVEQYNRGTDKHYLIFNYPSKLNSEFVEGGISYEFLNKD